MVGYSSEDEEGNPLGGQKIKKRPVEEKYYDNPGMPKLKYKQPDQGKVNMSDKKPDAAKHEGKNVFKPSEKPKCPGQMYVKPEKKEHNEQDFAGEQKQKRMY